MELGKGKQSQELDVITMHGLTLAKDTSPSLVKLNAPLQLLTGQHCSEKKSEEFVSLTFFLQQDRVPTGRSSISHLLYGATYLCFATLLAAFKL